MSFLDQTESFDSVNHQALWTILSKYGCSEMLIRILRLSHDSIPAAVKTN